MPAVSAKPAEAREYFKVLRSKRDQDDRLTSVVRADVRAIETDFDINVEWAGIREVYRHKVMRAWLVPGKHWLCLVIRARGGSSACSTVARARRGELGTTYVAGSHGGGWVEEYHVMPDVARHVVIRAESGWIKRPRVRRSRLHAFFPTPAELTFRLHGTAVRLPFPDIGFYGKR